MVTVAHDWGGPISLGWALAHRDQLAGVVLANTAVHQPAGSPAPALIRLLARQGSCVRSASRRPRSCAGRPPCPGRGCRRRSATPSPLPMPRPTVAAPSPTSWPTSRSRTTTPPCLRSRGSPPEWATSRCRCCWPGGRATRCSPTATCGTCRPAPARGRPPLRGRLPPGRRGRPGVLRRRPCVGRRTRAAASSRPRRTPATDRRPMGAALALRAADPVTPTRSPSPSSGDRAVDHLGPAGRGRRRPRGRVARGRGPTRRARRPPRAARCRPDRRRLRVLADRRRDRGRRRRAGCPRAGTGAARGLAPSISSRSTAACWPRRGPCGSAAAVSRSGRCPPARARLLGAEATLWPLAERGRGHDLPGAGPGRRRRPSCSPPARRAPPRVSSTATARSRPTASARSTYAVTSDDRLVAAFAPFALYGPAMGIASAVPDMDVTKPGTLDAARAGGRRARRRRHPRLGLTGGAAQRRRHGRRPRPGSPRRPGRSACS